eukprot:SAG22_NODE_3097_length_1945_cov_1.362405_1_plen_38_part_10
MGAGGGGGKWQYPPCLTLTPIHDLGGLHRGEEPAALGP